MLRNKAISREGMTKGGLLLFCLDLVLFKKRDWCLPLSFSPTGRRRAGLLNNINEVIDEKFDR